MLKYHLYCFFVYPIYLKNMMEIGLQFHNIHHSMKKYDLLQSYYSISTYKKRGIHHDDHA